MRGRTAPVAGPVLMLRSNGWPSRHGVEFLPTATRQPCIPQPFAGSTAAASAELFSPMRRAPLRNPAGREAGLQSYVNLRQRVLFI